MEQQIEMSKERYDDEMIRAYVPEADQVSRAEAIVLAYLRDAEVAAEVYQSKDD